MRPSALAARALRPLLILAGLAVIAWLLFEIGPRAVWDTMIPASLGALEGGYVAFFGAFGLAGAVGFSYTLVRRLREAAWAGAGYVWLASLRARPSLAEDDANE